MSQSCSWVAANFLTLKFECGVRLDLLKTHEMNILDSAGFLYTLQSEIVPLCLYVNFGYQG